MEPFNINIQHNNEYVTITILPEKDYFKLIYFGGLIGAIREREGEWELLEENEIECTSPLYVDKYRDNDQLKLELTLPKVNQIAAEIENFIY